MLTDFRDRPPRPNEVDLQHWLVHVRKHFEAITQFETLRARRERAVLVVEVWRSMESTRRKGNLQ